MFENIFLAVYFNIINKQQLYICVHDGKPNVNANHYFCKSLLFTCTLSEFQDDISFMGQYIYHAMGRLSR